MVEKMRIITASDGTTAAFVWIVQPRYSLLAVVLLSSERLADADQTSFKQGK
jgi:hypothetical protein